MKPLHEQYRPKTWPEVVGQGKVLGEIDAIRRRGLAGRSFWISGKSGQGKTTIAKLLASEIADDMNIEELDAGELTPVRLKTIENDMGSYGFGVKTGRCFIINEAHGLRKAAIRQLLVLLERLPVHVAVIFTTTTEGQDLLFEDNEDTGPLLSRCICLKLAQRDIAKPFADRAKQIAEIENLNGQPIDKYVKLVQNHKNNLRAVLQEIEKGAMLNG